MSMRKLGTVFGLALLLAGLPAQGQAQQEQFYVEGRGGLGLGLGDIGFLQDVGPTFGVDFGYWIHERIAIRVGGDASLLSGEDRDLSPPEGQRVLANAPDMDFYQYGAGVELLITEPASPLEVRLGAGAGATTVESDPLPGSLTISQEGTDRLGNTVCETGTEREYSTTEFTLNGDVKVGYEVAPRFNVFAGTRAYLFFPNECETEVFHQIAEEADQRGFDTGWTLPLFVGVKIGF